MENSISEVKSSKTSPIIDNTYQPESNGISSLRFEYDTLIEEYRTVNAQILHRLETDEKNYDLTMLTFGAIVAASSIVINFKVYNLLLLLAIPFHILIWEQVRRTIIGKHLAKYVTDELVPRLNAIIQSAATNREAFGNPIQYMSWEGYSHSLFYQRTRTSFAMLLPKAGKAALQFGAALFLVVIYLYLQAYDSQYVLTPFDTILLLINLLVALISVVSLSALGSRQK
jgi:hypothetical protein